MGRCRTAYMIMVRQLESMIRLSSVLARFHCEDVSSFDKKYNEGEYTDKDENKDGETTDKKFLTWGETLQWYLEQCEEQIGDSVEELKQLEKLTNMVIRRLINIDHILIYLGGESVPMMNDEKDRTIAVHPNYVV